MPFLFSVLSFFSWSSFQCVYEDHTKTYCSQDPGTRKVKVITVGAGFSGIMMAYKIQKYTKNVDLKIYEKNADIGGTWLENRYPGCACDVPSHAYTYPWALNVS